MSVESSGLAIALVIPGLLIANIGDVGKLDIGNQCPDPSVSTSFIELGVAMQIRREKWLTMHE